jgi:hypothetical protein
LQEYQTIPPSVALVGFRLWAVNGQTGSQGQLTLISQVSKSIFLTVHECNGDCFNNHRAEPEFLHASAQRKRGTLSAYEKIRAPPSCNFSGLRFTTSCRLSRDDPHTGKVPRARSKCHEGGQYTRNPPSGCGPIAKPPTDRKPAANPPTATPPTASPPNATKPKANPPTLTTPNPKASDRDHPCRNSTDGNNTHRNVAYRH